MNIREAVLEDAERISEIRRQDGIKEKVLALSSERISITENFLKSLNEYDRFFVAEEDDTLVGFATINRNREPARSHAASVTVMVDTNYSGRGIGSQLMKRVIECVDNELKYHRTELLVLTDNQKAIKLYKNFGFAIEATKKHAAVVNGRFVDEFLMGRLRKEEK